MGDHTYMIFYRWEDEDEFKKLYQSHEYPLTKPTLGSTVDFKDFTHSPGPEPPVITKGEIIEEIVERSEELKITKFQWVLRRVP